MSKNAITFNMYEKISDNLYWLAPDVMLRFNVGLGMKNKEGGSKKSFHQEFVYDSKYTNINKSRTIRRNIDCYISIDIKDDFDNSVMIRYQNMIMLKLQMQNVVKWFTTIFKMKDGELIISGKYDKIIVPLEFGKAIMFEPIVVQYENKTYTEGVRLYLNSDLCFIDIPVDRFMGFYYIIDTFDMYGNALALLNYIQRPEFGYNTFSFNNESYENFDSKAKVDVIYGKSFFDKM